MHLEARRRKTGKNWSHIARTRSVPRTPPVLAMVQVLHYTGLSAGVVGRAAERSFPTYASRECGLRARRRHADLHALHCAAQSLVRRPSGPSRGIGAACGGMAKACQRCQTGVTLASCQEASNRKPQLRSGACDVGITRMIKRIAASFHRAAQRPPPTWPENGQTTIAPLSPASNAAICARMRSLVRKRPPCASSSLPQTMGKVHRM